MQNIAIIGAGLSGLTAAKQLSQYANVTLFEKSRGVGGRMSTRRAEPYFFDHGVPCFEAYSDEFKEFLSPMIKAGVVARWDARFVEFRNGRIETRQQWGADCPHYVGLPAMNAMAKYLARDLCVHVGVRVQSVVKKGDTWALMDDKGKSREGFDWVISAVPAQQAVGLLPESVNFYNEMGKVEMKPCYSLMLGFDSAFSLDFEAASIQGADIQWIAVNNSKPERQSSLSLVVQSNSQWASEHMGDDHEHIIRELCEKAGELMGCDLSCPDHKALHCWRFAVIDGELSSAFLLDADQRLAVCGDWFKDGGVEAAYRSGFELANAMRDSLNLGRWDCG